MPRFFILLPALLLGACAYHTSRSSIVVVTDAKSVVENCAKLGEVDGQDSSQVIMPLDKTRDSVITRLKIAAAELGGLMSSPTLPTSNGRARTPRAPSTSATPERRASHAAVS